MTKQTNFFNQETPFVESEFYHKLKLQDKDKEYISISDHLHENGYCIVDLGIDPELIDEVNRDVDKEIEKGTFKKNSKAYHYNESPRIVEGWQFSGAIKKVALNEKLNSILKFCYDSDPIPFSTINFLKGTEQPLHSDEFHFGSIPHRFLTGCWIALEDIHPDSGPLSIAAKSHRLPLFSFERINLPIPKSEKEFKEYYTMYEDWVREMIDTNDLEIVTPKLKKGQCLIWLSNLLHGSFKIRDRSLSRKSLVVHFHYKRCEKIFYPSHSNLEEEKFVPRKIKDLDIRNK